MVTLDEVFLARDYEVPPEVSERLGDAPSVLDLGANGLLRPVRAAPAARRPHHAVEPDPDNVGLRRLIAANDVPEERWRVVAACAAERAAIEFLAGAYSLSRLAAAAEPPPGARPVRVPAVDALALLEQADLAKIDIEGGEGDRGRSAVRGQCAARGRPRVPPGAVPRASIRTPWRGGAWKRRSWRCGRCGVAPTGTGSFGDGSRRGERAAGTDVLDRPPRAAW